MMKIGHVNVIVFVFLCAPVFSNWPLGEVDKCKQCVRGFNHYCPADTGNKCKSGWGLSKKDCFDSETSIITVSQCDCLSQKSGDNCYECVKAANCHWVPFDNKCYGNLSSGPKDPNKLTSTAQCKTHDQTTKDAANALLIIILVPIFMFLCCVGIVVACCVFGVCACANANQRRPVRMIQPLGYQPQIRPPQYIMAPQQGYQNYPVQQQQQPQNHQAGAL